MNKGLFKIGAVTGAHGIKGDIKVYPLTDDVKRFEKLEAVMVGTKEFEIEKVWYHKKLVMLKLKGIDTMNDALALKGADIKIDEQFAIPLEEGEFFIRDLYDMEVVTEDGEVLGLITDVLATGANDVYEVNKNLYIPAIKDCILNIDIINKRMTVHLLEGLRE